MNKLKSFALPNDQNILYVTSQKFPWLHNIDEWRSCFQTQPPSKCGMLLLNSNIDNLHTLFKLKSEAKKYKVNLPINLDPNRHFGYEILSAPRDRPSCCDIQFFLPYKSPYVPMILRCLINHLEDNSTNVEYLYYKNLYYSGRARRILINLSNSDQNYRSLMDIIRLENIENVAMAVLIFLQSLCDILLENLDFHRRDKQTNSKSNSRTSRLASHETASFVMIHLLHILEFSKDSSDSVYMLSRVFAPVLLRNRIEEEKAEDDMEEENEKFQDDDFEKNEVFLEQLLVESDYKFWYCRLNYPKRILDLFNGVTPKEKRLFRKLFQSS